MRICYDARMQRILEHEPLKPYITLQVGGTAQYFTEAHTHEEMRESILWANERALSWRMLGGGSNVICHDDELPGLTIHNRILSRSAEMQGENVYVRVGAGESFDEIVSWCCQSGWWGLENLSAIPGSVGATPVQNVGAYGVETADILDEVVVYDARTDSTKRLTREECAFGYRHSRFKEESGRHLVILEVVFVLRTHAAPLISYADLTKYFEDTNAPQTPQEVRDAVVAIRARKFPNWREMGTAGSFFKNPIIATAHYEELRLKYPQLPGHIVSPHETKVSLGWILDHVCAMRGVRQGAVGTYGAQALVMVNYGGATAEDIFSFAHAIELCVKEKTGITIEREVTLLQ